LGSHENGVFWNIFLWKTKVQLFQNWQTLHSFRHSVYNTAVRGENLIKKIPLA
jgi:hypothetical protein